MLVGSLLGTAAIGVVFKSIGEIGLGVSGIGFASTGGTGLIGLIGSIVGVGDPLSDTGVTVTFSFTIGVILGIGLADAPGTVTGGVSLIGVKVGETVPGSESTGEAPIGVGPIGSGVAGAIGLIGSILGIVFTDSIGGTTGVGA